MFVDVRAAALCEPRTASPMPQKENIPPTTKYYCKVVNNKYYDNNGNVVTKSAYENACKYYQAFENDPEWELLLNSAMSSGMVASD